MPHPIIIRVGRNKGQVVVDGIPQALRQVRAAIRPLFREAGDYSIIVHVKTEAAEE